MKDYGVDAQEITIFCDKTSVIPITHNLVLHLRTKHVDIKIHFISDHSQKKDFKLEYISTTLYLLDIFPKPLCETRFSTQRHEIGMIEMSLKLVMTI